jgi:hypothetical protein
MGRNTTNLIVAVIAIPAVIIMCVRAIINLVFGNLDLVNVYLAFYFVFVLSAFFLKLRK